MWPTATPSRIVARRNTTWLTHGMEQLDTLIENICGAAWRLVAANVQRQPRRIPAREHVLRRGRAHR
jgi:hypothetical protein